MEKRRAEFWKRTGWRSYEELSSLEKTYYDQCRSFLDGNTENADTWAAYASRIQAVQLIENGNIEYINEKYVQNTLGIRSEPLYDLEVLAFMKIITGEETVDYFDQFVEEWNKNGGAEFIKRKEEVLKKKKS